MSEFKPLRKMFVHRGKFHDKVNDLWRLFISKWLMKIIHFSKISYRLIYIVITILVRKIKVLSLHSKNHNTLHWAQSPFIKKISMI